MNKEELNACLEGVINSYSSIMNNRSKKMIRGDPVIDLVLEGKGFEYKGRKRTCDYYQKGNHVFIRKIRLNKFKVATKTGHIKTIKEKKFDYASCFIDSNNFNEFKKMFDAKVHRIKYGEIPERKRALIDFSSSVAGFAGGYYFLDGLGYGILGGVLGLIAGIFVSNFISTKRYLANIPKMFNFNKRCNDYVFYNKQALEKLLL